MLSQASPDTRPDGGTVDPAAIVLAATAGGLFLAPFAYAAMGGPHVGGGTACLARQAVGALVAGFVGVAGQQHEF